VTAGHSESSRSTMHSPTSGVTPTGERRSI
jgi:hypothetical protein